APTSTSTAGRISADRTITPPNDAASSGAEERTSYELDPDRDMDWLPGARRGRGSCGTRGLSRQGTDGRATGARPVRVPPGGPPGHWRRSGCARGAEARHAGPR